MTVPAIPADYFDTFIAEQLAKQQDQPPMSTEADIDWDEIDREASRLLTRYRNATPSKDRLDRMERHSYWCARVAHDVAARDMRERCAEVAEEWDGLDNVAARIRALSDTAPLIATDGGTAS